VLAGLINAIKLRGSKKEEVNIVMNGAGAAGTAIAKLLLTYGFKNILIVDRSGIIYEGRPDLNPEKIKLAAITNLSKKEGSLEAAVRDMDIFIGVSSPGVLSAEMIEKMAPKPIIFALANPVPEIMPELALESGAYIVATGRSDYPNQINNVLAFPGIFRGALDNKVKQISDEMLIRAAEVLASLVKTPSVDLVLPNPFNKEIAREIAKVIF
jgi:malate dehydrogenase (oxaloacetate-decarboxylating)